jgi:hypothetical protein
MTANQADKLATTAPMTQTAHLAGLVAWERRRKWSRTDTARQLGECGAALLAHFRRQYPAVRVTHTTQFGFWLREHAPALFDRAHAKLSACADDAARAHLLPSELL